MKLLGKKPVVIAVVVAAGRGSRFGGAHPKQYASLGGMTVLRRTLNAFLSHPRIDDVITVIHTDDSSLYFETVADVVSPKLSAPQTGADTRQGSVLLGLDFASTFYGSETGVVLIHDAARPFVSHDLIDRAIEAATLHRAAVPAMPVTDTLISCIEGVRKSSFDRAAMRSVQTPQAFRFDLILAAHEAAFKRQETHHTDDGSVAAAEGHDVHVFNGESGNTKITTQDDLMNAEARLNPQHSLISRTATGFDVHAFGEGDHLWLCGVKIPYSKGFVAHSDGDVALHALTDALLGTMADGDIGRHFPPSDIQWKGAASDQFLRFAVERLHNRGGIIDLMDVTIICEAPKIGPHAETMRQRVAEIAGIKTSAVSVKATTTERLGFNGRGEGISALATVTIRMPD